MNLGRWGLVSVAPALLLALSGCGGGGADTQSATASGGCTDVAEPPPKELTLKAPKLGRPPKALSATVETNCGSFVIALDGKRAPKTVVSFAYLVRKGAYDNSPFHRIVPDFVIQAGDPTGSGAGGPGYSIDEPPPTDVAYTRGTAAMARSPAEPPGRSGSQFFVVTAGDAGLDASYALLGKVTSGLDVVERIGQLGTPGGVPTANVVISKITLAKG